MKIGIFVLSLACFESVWSSPIDVPKGIYKYEDRYIGHQGDYPFPTDMTFKWLCEHQITGLLDSFDPDKVKEGDTVYVADWYLPWFRSEVHPQIQQPYILVCNDTDGWHPLVENRLLLHDPKIIAWFCKNFILSNHPKLFQIPIGQNIIYWNSFSPDNEKKYLKQLVAKRHFDKSNLIYLNLTSRDDGHRDLIVNLFKNAPFVYFKDGTLGRMTYWDELAHSKFAFCPPGLGFDTVRFWEAIVLGTIPVIVHTPLDELYEGTPALFVDRWEDINSDLLNRKYAEIQDKIQKGELSNQKGFIDYWWNKVNEVQIQARAKRWKGSDLETAKFSQGEINVINEILLERQDYKKYALFVYGRFLGLRSLQMSHHFTYLDTVTIADPYAGGAAECNNYVKMLRDFAKEDLVFDRADRLQVVDDHNLVNALKKRIAEKRKVNYRVFMDLTHYRFNFIKDLSELYAALPKGMIICGNMYKDPWVKNQIENFSSQKGYQLRSKVDCWYLIKD